MVMKGENFTTKRQKLESDLIKEMLDNGSWKTLQFKE